jgi:hypothetical protein
LPPSYTYQLIEKHFDCEHGNELVCLIVKEDSMKRILLMMLAGIAAWNTGAFCQILAYEVKVDTSIYDLYTWAGFYFYPGPGIEDIYSLNDPSSGNSRARPGMLLGAYKRKNSNKFDILSFSGKIGMGTMPDSISGVGNGEINVRCFLSINFINDDPEWECLANYIDYTEPGYRGYFKVLNANGDVLLSDTGNAQYGFDGQNTYVFTGGPRLSSSSVCKAWRFRSNINSGSHNNLSKVSGVYPKIMTAYGPQGDYCIRFAPSSGGKTSITLFDMLGRCVFSKDIGSVNAPMTITIPENGIPPSPFVAKVRNENGTVLRKELPVR